MKTAIIIPARLGSTRLPRKPLQTIAGMSLIERVYRQCKQASGIDAVFIATDSDEIASHVNSFGAGAIITPETCANGTERVSFAARHLSEEFEIIINVQGDEPLISPGLIEAIAEALKDPAVTIATPISQIKDRSDRDNPHIVKVITGADDTILYFSRSLIPYSSTDSAFVYWRHVGLYGFRRKILEEIRHLPPTELEDQERLEQLRWLYHGYKIKAIRTQFTSIEVNTPEDLEKVEAVLGR